MLKGSESGDSDSASLPDSGDESTTEWRPQVVLRPAVLRANMELEPDRLQQVLARQEEEEQRLRAMQQQAAQEAQRSIEQLEVAKLQTATSLDLRKEIMGVESYGGEVGDLNHFLRSGDSIVARVESRLNSGRLDPLDAASLRATLIRRIRRSVLNRIQAEETSAWEDVKARLQKEFGGGRWTPEEDTLRMLRLVRGQGQSKGDYASAVLASYLEVVAKYRETMTGPEAERCLSVIEKLAVAQLGEAVGRKLNLGLVEEANAIIDMAGRGEEGEEAWKQPVRRGERRRREEWRRVNQRPAPTKRTWERRQERVPPRDSNRAKGVKDSQGPGDRACYTCGKTGHLQFRCPVVRCFECGAGGHMARACPYIYRRITRGEPMEVNHHREVEKGRRGERRRVQDDSDVDDFEEGEPESEAAESLRSFATVVRQERKAHRHASDKRVPRTG